VPWTLPPLPDRALLADLCREAAAATGVQPQLVEKDFHLTRLLGALGNRLGESLLLKGGTLLSKVDLGFFRMSEDADLVIPGEPSRNGGVNSRRLEPLRAALNELQGVLGARVVLRGGERFDRNSHVLWQLDYQSEFGRQFIRVEGTIRPVFMPSRRVLLRQILEDPLVGNYSDAACYALNADEARAEKVRAAFTREAIRDYYDLDRLAALGVDFSSEAFLKLVDAKLAELAATPFAQQPRSFGMTAQRRTALDQSLLRDLPAVLRQGAPPFELDAMLRRFDALWRK
jgi:predicted nucleotidyltransferase component of viral defense system